jgi:hypothetical protein
MLFMLAVLRSALVPRILFMLFMLFMLAAPFRALVPLKLRTAGLSVPAVDKAAVLLATTAFLVALRLVIRDFFWMAIFISPDEFLLLKVLIALRSAMVFSKPGAKPEIAVGQASLQKME